MNQFVRNLVWGCLSFLMTGAVVSTQGQSVFDPNDPVVIYNPSNPPVQPAFGQPGKWVKTNRVNWNTSSFKAYIYKGVQFRLKWPKNYDPSGNTKYPLLVFFHGKGERGSIYDNEYQLYHGGELHRNAVDNGTFNGFLLYPQSDDPSSNFGDEKRAFVMELIENFLIPEVNIDPFRVNINGLSLGGFQTWQFFISYPKLVASISPISNAASSTADYIVQNKFIPIWLFQGALDQNPKPEIAQYLYKKAQQAGANFKYTEYPDLGHGSWYAAWNEPGYFPFINRAHKANPWPLFGRTEFCPDQPINTTIGVTAGFDEYQWRRGEQLLTGLGTTSNTLTVTSLGVYSCRVRKGTLWSPWSPIPVEIKHKTATIPPIIDISGLASRVLPAPDGKTTVNLEVPTGYTSYNWQRVGSSSTVSIANVLNGATVGSYRVQVTEQFGCSSAFTEPFDVINANGPNKPDPATSLIVVPLSYTALKLNWSSNPNPAYPQTNFEIYQATKAGGPYQFVSMVDGDMFTFTKEGLTPGVKYYYIVRAINNTAAAPVSNEASATTQKDGEPPSAPANLKITGTTRSYVGLAWDESSDNVGLDHYDIYINGVKSYVSSGTEFTAYNLEYGKTYNFSVKAVDIAGNNSAFSNQVTTQPLAKGLTFKHYTGTWSTLPDFNTLTPILTGVVPNVSLSNRTQSENYGFLWEGYIHIPSDGTYTFRTTSDDGSKLYLSPYGYTATALVDNDGLHGSRDEEGSIYLTAGIYPIAITFFQQGGGANMSVSWRKTGIGGWAMQPIPDAAFIDSPVPSGGIAPAKPSNLSATAMSYNKINLSWTDNSNNEKSFEIFRSTDALTGFTTVGVLPANANNFSDTLVKPATTYYYKIRAINQYGESPFDKVGPGVDYAYYQQTGMTVVPDFNTLIPVKSGRLGNFSLGMQQQANNFAVKFDGFITVPTTGNYTFYLKSDDGSRLYIDNSQVVNNDGLHNANNEISGSVHLNAGVHAIRVTFFEATGDEVLNVSYSGPGINKQIIPGTVLGDVLASATTLAAPPTPVAPSSLIAVATSSSVIKTGWVNNATNATSIELYRSYNGNSDYVLLATLPANTTSYNDTALYPSSLYYYKIRAVGEGGNSGYSNEVSARTRGVVPSILPIENVYMRFNSIVVLPVEATSGSPIDITLNVSNLPSFAVFVQTGNGKGTITFAPSEGDQRVYNNIIVTATNPQNDINTAKFNLTVNADYVPVLNAVPNVSVNEMQTAQLNLSATDQDAGDNLSWSFTGLPGFATASPANRNASITIAPKYGDAGVYTIKATVNDGRNGRDTTSFKVTVVHSEVTNPNDGTAPIKPGNVTAQFVSSVNAVKVSWTNMAYNATGFEIFRSTTLSGYYTLLNPGATNKDSTSYHDYTAVGNMTYFYVVRAINANGGNNSAIIKIVTPNRAPLITADDIYIRSGNTSNVNIAAVDDPGNQITLAISNLPSFASFTDNGNGAGVIQFAPTGTHIGTYTLMIQATDDHDAVSSKEIKLVVVDKYITTVYVNFNQTDPVGFPWNSFNAKPNANTQLSNLKDETNTATGINVTLLQSFTSHTSGQVTGTNSGIYPDDVIKTGYYFTSAGGVTEKTIRLSGLSQNNKYNLKIFGSRSSGTNPTYVDYEAGGQTVTLSTYGNTNNVAIIKGLIPNATGQIDLRIIRQGLLHATINALVIESYTGEDIVFPPFNLGMTSSTNNSISLSWKCIAENVSEFEVWRSDSPQGTYVKLPVSVPGNVFKYTDNGLQKGTVYYYKLRAVSGTSYSEFSDYVNAATVSYAIDINFNDGFAGPAEPSPWNNVNELITTGFTMNNFVNRDNQYTGIGMTVVSNFGGFNVNGPTTGNNSGPVPDNVMLSYYYMEYGVIARLRITGLNQSMRYNFIFFGSRKANGIGQTTSYSIGDQTVLLDCKDNTTTTVQINNIQPDASGNAEIVITSALPGGNGYLNSLTIQAIPTAAGSGSGSSGRTSLSSGNVQNAGSALTSGSGIEQEKDDVVISAYPNPFVEDIVLNVSLKKKTSKLVVFLKDFSGRTVFTTHLMNVPAGTSQHRLNVNGRTLSPGIYGIQLINASDGKGKTIKVIKN